MDKSWANCLKDTQSITDFDVDDTSVGRIERFIIHLEPWFFFIQYFFTEGKKAKGWLGMMCLGDWVGRAINFTSVHPCVRDRRQITRALSNIVKLSNAKNHALNSTFPTIKTTRRSAQKLIKLIDLGRVIGALMWNTFTVALHNGHCCR